MANKTIAELTSTTSAQGGDLVPTWRFANGDTRYITKNNLLADVYNKTNIYLVDANFTLNTGAKRYTTIQAAITAGGADITILIAPGTYTENITVAHNGVRLFGSGMPYYDENGTGRLVGGTIIRGTLNMGMSIGAVVQDLGVDVYTQGSTDGLTAGNDAPTDVYQTYRNIAILGNGWGAQDHAFLAGGANHLTIDNLRMWNWYHGLTLRCSYVNATNIYADECTADSIIVKSEAGTGDAVHVNISNVIINGDPSNGALRGGPIKIQSAEDGYSTRYVNVNNVTAQYAGEATIMLQRAYESSAFRGTLSNVEISNVIASDGGDASTRACFDVQGGTNITFSNCSSLARDAGYGFRVGYGGDTPTEIEVHDSRSDSGGAGRYAETTGVFDFLELDGQIVVSRQMIAFPKATTGALELRNGATIHGHYTSTNGGATEIFRLVCTAGIDSVVAVEIMICSNSGDHGSIDIWRVVGIRYTGTTVRGAAAQDGTRLVDSGGTHGVVAISVDVATANTLKIISTGSAAAAGISFVARILPDSANAWTVENLTT